MDYYLW